MNYQDIKKYDKKLEIETVWYDTNWLMDQRKELINRHCQLIYDTDNRVVQSRKEGSF